VGPVAPANARSDAPLKTKAAVSVITAADISLRIGASSPDRNFDKPQTAAR
jgi:hypothetical protein